MRVKNLLIDQLQGDFMSLQQYNNCNTADKWYVVIHVPSLRCKYVAQVSKQAVNRRTNVKKPFTIITSANARSKALHRLRVFLLNNNIRFNISDIAESNVLVYHKEQYEQVRNGWVTSAIVI